MERREFLKLALGFTAVAGSIAAAAATAQAAPVLPRAEGAIGQGETAAIADAATKSTQSGGAASTDTEFGARHRRRWRRRWRRRYWSRRYWRPRHWRHRYWRRRRRRVIIL